jgi:hypothetical protein
VNVARWPMTKRLSSIAVNVFCCLLAVAMSAFAECAWVFWYEASDMKTHEVDGPTPKASYKAAEECIKGIDEE